MPPRGLPGQGIHPPPPATSGGGPVVGDPDDPIEIHEGDEHEFAFSFYIEPAVYRAPGDENLIMRFAGDPGESPSFALQLWDDGSGSQRGLWASGDAMGGERFLAPVAEGTWHEAVIDFRASSEGDGFYLLTLDDQPIDARAWVSLIDSASGAANLEVGLFRGGERVATPSDVFFGPTRLADAFAA